MTPRSRSLRVAALAAALVLAPSTAYAVQRPHTSSDLVAHDAIPGAPLQLPTSDLPTGPSPAIAYAAATHVDFLGGDWVLHRPDGTTLALPTLTWTAWAPVGDGVVGMAGTEAGPLVQQVSGAGQVASHLISSFGLAVSPDGTAAAWLGHHHVPHVVTDAGTQDLARVPGAGPDTLAAVGACSAGPGPESRVPAAGDCAVYVDSAHRAWVSTPDGTSPVTGLQRVSDVSAQGWVAGRVSRGHDASTGCWGVLDPGGHRTMRTCRYYLDAFSPDGRLLLAERSDATWPSVRQLAVLDRHGTVVRAWTVQVGARSTLSQLTWEDDSHLLGVLQHGQTWSVVRIGTDGSVEQAGPSVEAAGDQAPFTLPVR